MPPIQLRQPFGYNFYETFLPFPLPFSHRCNSLSRWPRGKPEDGLGNP